MVEEGIVETLAVGYLAGGYKSFWGQSGQNESGCLFFLRKQPLQRGEMPIRQGLHCLHAILDVDDVASCWLYC